MFRLVEPVNFECIGISKLNSEGVFLSYRLNVPLTARGTSVWLMGLLDDDLEMQFCDRNFCSRGDFWTVSERCLKNEGFWETLAAKF